MAEQFIHLVESCGHHCGAHMAGKNKIVRHCMCSECHDSIPLEQGETTNVNDTAN